ncbi:hypothetical protein BD311DRAFT_807171 [Dichomitus squalens]|uniref:Uncharacterized protein n=1 Tax=Dichomitus squalens TaxID=114155 RepID=A0A4Q9MM86_9APHY|nr:hypothetical protein BD311DRAFT_807171 [Dichomitus squalens]
MFSTDQIQSDRLPPRITPAITFLTSINSQSSSPLSTSSSSVRSHNTGDPKSCSSSSPVADSAAPTSSQQPSLSTQQPVPFASSWTGTSAAATTFSLFNPAPQATSSPAVSYHKQSSRGDTGAIVGGVIGALAFLALLAIIASFLVRRRRKSLQPPSAEFMFIVRGRRKLDIVPTYWRETPAEDKKRPPAVHATSPMPENVQASAAMWEQYEETSEEGGYQ